MSANVPLLEVRGIRKQFPGVLALDGVSARLHAGEVLAVVGENGAGKSTLMKIMAGIYQPDAGSIQLAGQTVSFRNVSEALAAGMPVLVSNVCDHPILVAEGERGFLFDPADPASISAAIARLAGLDAGDWRSISRNARLYAMENLDVETMITAYEKLFAQLLSGGPRERGES